MSKGLLNALEIAIGLIAFLIVASLVLNLTNQGKATVNQVSSEVDNMTSSAIETKYTDYDGEQVMGSKVLSAISQFANDDVCIQVQNLSETFQCIHAATINGTNATLTDGAVLTYKEAKAKINPNAHFTGSVLRDPATNAVTAIIFLQDGVAAPANP